MVLETNKHKCRKNWSDNTNQQKKTYQNINKTILSKIGNQANVHRCCIGMKRKGKNRDVKTKNYRCPGLKKENRVTLQPWSHLAENARGNRIYTSIHPDITVHVSKHK